MFDLPFDEFGIWCNVSMIEDDEDDVSDEEKYQSNDHQDDTFDGILEVVDVEKMLDY
jgi:hypothetical protein